ncbi:MAG: hypothetical protein Q9198_005392 [Flavoplaca austrocitrina]
MAWHLLFIVLLATLVCASLPQFNDKAQHQIPLGDPLANPSFVRETKVVSAEGSLPTIDLGYTKHQAIHNLLNPKLYRFQNIRYAAPPTGDLRFRAPQPPLQAPEWMVEDGLGRKECPQATVKWAETFPEDVCEDCECCKVEDVRGDCLEPCSGGKPLWGSTKRQLGGLMPPVELDDPKLYSENCLFLDVLTPKDVFNGKTKVPVFVWIYGGAYVFGGKSLYFPGGLIDRATINEQGGMIFVAMNYRMGALGFAAGKDIDDEDINAGLLDQQQALQWVQEHISKFGGDPAQVTVAGLSAGGGSVLHHLTAYGRTEGAPFQRAISFSGGWQPVTNKETAEGTFQKFMQEYNNVSTLDELRKVPEEQMMQANSKQISEAPPGSFLYNPTAWGHFTPESPSKLFKQGRFAKEVEVMLSHAFDEGGQFIKAFKEHKTTVEEFLDLTFPDVTPDEKKWILATYDSGKDDAGDISKIIADVTFRCHITYVSDAKEKNVWLQRWNIANSNTHGGDLLFLFYQPVVPILSVRSARILQDYTVTFALTGEPQTYINNPYPVPGLETYYPYFWDDKEQFLDSGIYFPHVTRGNPEGEDVCREWQKMSST